MKAHVMARERTCRDPMLRVGKETRTSDFLTTFLAAQRGGLYAAHIVYVFARSRHVSYKSIMRQSERIVCYARAAVRQHALDGLNA
jgi:hypothetical protein